MNATPSGGPPAVPPVTSYRVVSFHGRSFLYSAATDRLYPLAPNAAAVLERSGFDQDMLWALELSCSGTACQPVPAQPDPAASRTELRRALETEVQQIVLGVTENCNLRCQYCIYSGVYAGVRTHSAERMSWDVARKAIDYLLAHRSASTFPPGIAFYGGEPLLELDLIRRCVEYATAQSGGAARFVITTNGTLLNEAARALAVAHDFTLIISLDGPQAVHDRYRCDTAGRPTFDRIMANLEALRHEAPAYYRDRLRFSAVLAPPIDYRTLDAFFTEVGAPCVVSPLDLYHMDEAWHRRANRPDFEPMAAALERDCRQGVPNGADRWRYFSVGLLGPVLRRIQSRSERPDAVYYRLGQCIPGARKVFVAPNGDLYPCEKVEGHTDVLIGHVDTGVDAEAAERLLTFFADTVTEHCTGCWMRRMCSACLADVVHGGQIDREKLNTRCPSRREAHADVLGLYAALLEEDPTFLDFLPAAFPWG